MLVLYNAGYFFFGASRVEQKINLEQPFTAHEEPAGHGAWDYVVERHLSCPAASLSSINHVEGAAGGVARCCHHVRWCQCRVQKVWKVWGTAPSQWMYLNPLTGVVLITAGAVG